MALELYAENVLDHYRNPRNKGALEKPFAAARESNLLCGDVLSFELAFSKGKVAQVRFNGAGCALSQACASMLSEKVTGKSAAWVLRLRPSFVFGLLGFEVKGSRSGCALLGLRALQSAASKAVAGKKWRKRKITCRGKRGYL